MPNMSVGVTEWLKHGEKSTFYCRYFPNDDKSCYIGLFLDTRHPYMMQRCLGIALHYKK